MASQKDEYPFSPENMLDQINKKLYTLKGVLNSEDLNFEESKSNIIESIESIQHCVSRLQINALEHGLNKQFTFKVFAKRILLQSDTFAK